MFSKKSKIFLSSAVCRFGPFVDQLYQGQLHHAARPSSPFFGGFTPHGSHRGDRVRSWSMTKEYVLESGGTASLKKWYKKQIVVARVSKQMSKWKYS